jgi:lysophospholipase L1-like esterase
MWKTKLFSVLIIICGIYSTTFAQKSNMVINGNLAMQSGRDAPKYWKGDGVPKTLVKENILATLNQAVEVTVKKSHRVQGYFLQNITPRHGFTKKYAILSGYVKSSKTYGGLLQIKKYKNGKCITFNSVFTQHSHQWELLKVAISLKDCDRIQVLCRYWRTKKFIGNTVAFGGISLQLTDKPLQSDDFATKKIKIVILGDSTVQTYAPGLGIVGWGQLFGSYFTNEVGVHNHALSGRSSKSFIADGLLGKVLKDKADFALIQFGHNDNHAKTEPKSTDAATDYKDYLRQYIAAFKQHNTKVIFVTPMCRMTFHKNGKLYNNLQPYADAMIEVAQDNDCVVLDLHSASKKLFEAIGPKCVKIYGRYGTDRTHFNRQGATEIVKLIIRELKRSKSPLVNYIK